MIEYDNTTHNDFMYFAGDGSWGDASDVVIVNVEELDGHFTEFLDEVNEWQRPNFMRWYVENQTHDQLEGDTACDVCYRWQSGTEDEILEELEAEENE
jgi:hypothetical protein